MTKTPATERAHVDFLLAEEKRLSAEVKHFGEEATRFARLHTDTSKVLDGLRTYLRSLGVEPDVAAFIVDYARVDLPVPSAAVATASSPTDVPSGPVTLRGRLVALLRARNNEPIRPVEAYEILVAQPGPPPDKRQVGPELSRGRKVGIFEVDDEHRYRLVDPQAASTRNRRGGAQ